MTIFRPSAPDEGRWPPPGIEDSSQDQLRVGHSHKKLGSRSLVRSRKSRCCTRPSIPTCSGCWKIKFQSQTVSSCETFSPIKMFLSLEKATCGAEMWASSGCTRTRVPGKDKLKTQKEGERLMVMLMTTDPPRVFRQVDEGWQVCRPSEHSSTSVQEVTCHVESRIFNFCRKVCHLRERVAVACEAFFASAVEPARPLRKQSVCDRSWIQIILLNHP